MQVTFSNLFPRTGNGRILSRSCTGCPLRSLFLDAESAMILQGLHFHPDLLQFEAPLLPRPLGLDEVPVGRESSLLLCINAAILLASSLYR